MTPIGARGGLSTADDRHGTRTRLGAADGALAPQYRARYSGADFGVRPLPKQTW
ncbi:hypothetical protein [Streptomyces griseorubiginosus]|uniref:hypothetical protein n=1 Tax=Streptomyces griseorubiginosus TaxID=67304 RepID=UPI001AD7C34D|nr:hypothetical protein [Streptomyces griseorubiginosus]MBO4255433.1 hypothetical protein [Streptomyces griseorubiginosus]